jgi:single-strand DNA-binding protein
LGVKFYNRETKAQDWTNYEAVVFAKEGSQADFYESALVEGSIVEVSGSGCQIKTFEGSNGAVNTIAILDSKLGFVSSSEAKPAPQTSAPQQQAQQEFPDSDIPF